MAFRLADRVCLINKGAIIKEGTPEEIFLDESILKLDLEIPRVLSVYKNLRRLLPEIKERPIPRTINELNILIKELFKKKIK